VKTIALVALLSLACGAPLRGQRIGDCPPSSHGRLIEVKSLRGVVADPIWAVIPKVQVTLQERSGEMFRDIRSVATDGEGKFDFGRIAPGRYRLTFAGPRGFCRLTIPVLLSAKGWAGFKLALPIAASDTCPGYCEESSRFEELNAEL
jgi:hypothetical protein